MPHTKGHVWGFCELDARGSQAKVPSGRARQSPASPRTASITIYHGMFSYVTCTPTRP